MQKIALFLLACSSVVPAAAQTATRPAVPGQNWDRLKALPTGTRMHVSADKMSRTCVLDAVTDEQLTCSKGRVVNTAHYTFGRAEIDNVKLTRYSGSTLAGLGIGAGAGAAISAAALRSDSFKSAGIAILTVGSAVAGALIAGPTDAFRGPTVYRRGKP